MHNFDLDPHSRCWFADPAKNGLLRLRNIIVCCGSVPSRGGGEGEWEWRPVKINLSFNIHPTPPCAPRPRCKVMIFPPKCCPPQAAPALGVDAVRADVLLHLPPGRGVRAHRHRGRPILRHHSGTPSPHEMLAK